MASPLAKFDGLELPAAADFHVHLRDGAMMVRSPDVFLPRAVAPPDQIQSLRRGGYATGRPLNN